MICPLSFSLLSWVENPFKNMPSSQIGKIALVAAAIFIGIALIFTILGITGALGAMLAHPLVAVAILTVVVVVILIAALSIGAYVHFHPPVRLPNNPSQSSSTTASSSYTSSRHSVDSSSSLDEAIPANFDDLMDHIFDGQHADAVHSAITRPLELFDSKDSLSRLEYGHTEARGRWISFLDQVNVPVNHFILIEITPNQWQAHTTQTEEIVDMTDNEKKTAFMLITNNFPTYET